MTKYKTTGFAPGDGSARVKSPRKGMLSIEAQRRKVAMLIARRPRNTFQLRAVGVSHPAGRVRELRLVGYRIDTYRVRASDSDGYKHDRVALYIYVRGPLRRRHG